MAERTPDARGGDPNVAALLTWFVPGAGHLYLGRVGPAVVAFVVLEGLYALGWLLTDGRTFEYLHPELRGPLATVLSPEVGNLGAMIAQLRTAGFGSDVPSPYPPGMALGCLASALSGLGNVVLMAHAHLTARTPRTAPRRGPHPALLAFSTWLVPGLGHVVQGRRLRGAIVFLLLVGTFACGTWLAEGSNLSRERHFYYWAGQFLLGLPAVATELVSGRPPVEGEIPLVDAGLLFACMAGLLNVLAMLDVFGVAEGRWLGTREAPADGAPAPGAADEPRGEGVP